MLLIVELTRAKKFLIVALKVVTLRWWQLSRELRSTYSRVTLPGVGIFSQICLLVRLLLVKYYAILIWRPGQKSTVTSTLSSYIVGDETW